MDEGSGQLGAAVWPGAAGCASHRRLMVPVMTGRLSDGWPRCWSDQPAVRFLTDGSEATVTGSEMNSCVPEEPQDGSHALRMLNAFGNAEEFLV